GSLGFPSLFIRVAPLWNPLTIVKISRPGPKSFPGAEDPPDSDTPRAKHALSEVEGTLSDRPKACHPERMRGI
ncbi:MAG TPA: hypothetical protein VI895_07250, partial [Bdellovibrionota bacterium]|nr:hypothetical protein [Bdellovibrionota bacterium]